MAVVVRMLRRRARRDSPTIWDDWLRPHWLELSGGPRSVNVDQRRWTVVGNLDSPRRGRVDRRGLVSLEGQRWSLDWWIGAEDRWHVPSLEVSTRQALLESTPVVETRLRVPGGDAVHRAFAARDAAGREAVVVEVENRTSVPFALAMAIRPYDVERVGGVGSVEVDDSGVRVDGRTAVLLPKAPRHVVAGHGADGDTAAVLFAGAATDVPPAAVTCPDGLAQLAMLFPLSHSSTLRLVLPLGGEDLDVAALPAAPQVVSGWQVHASRSTRVEVPDRRLKAATDSSLRHLLLRPHGLAAAAALDHFGFHEEAAILLSDPDELVRTEQPEDALVALVEHWALTRDADGARRAAPAVAALAGAVAARASSGDGSRTGPGAARALARLPLAAALFEVAGEHRAAADVRRTSEALSAAVSTSVTGDERSAPASVSEAGVHDADDHPSAIATLHAARRDLAAGTTGALARLSWALGAATTTWAWPTALPDGGSGGLGDGHDPAANAALLLFVRDLLVDDTGPGLLLGRVVPDAWLGQGWELHGAPTAHGVLSYAVRWHGERPALLWELEAHPGTGPVRLSAPGLDPGWSSEERQGEALLAPVAMPDRAPRRGLAIPVSIESSTRGRA